MDWYPSWQWSSPSNPQVYTILAQSLPNGKTMSLSERSNVYNAFEVLLHPFGTGWSALETDLVQNFFFLV